MNKPLVYGLAAALGIGGGLALFSMLGKRPEANTSAPAATEEVELVAPEAEGEVGKSERKPPPPKRELRASEQRLKEQLEGAFGMHTRTASPAWNVVAFELRGAGLDIDGAKAKEMGLALGAEMRNEDADVEALIAQERELIAELRGGPAGAVVESHLVRIETMISELEAPPEGDE